MDTRVEHKSELGRFEVYVGEREAGFTRYEDAGANRAFVHTEVYPRWEGLGLGKVLVQQALDTTAKEDLGVLPFCPFVLRFVSERPEYLRLVPEWARERFGLPKD